MNERSESHQSCRCKEQNGALERGTRLKSPCKDTHGRIGNDQNEIQDTGKECIAVSEDSLTQIRRKALKKAANPRFPQKQWRLRKNDDAGARARRSWVQRRCPEIRFQSAWFRWKQTPIRHKQREAQQRSQKVRQASKHRFQAPNL